MQTGQAQYGMQTFNQSLATLVLQEADHAAAGAVDVVEPGRAAGDDQPRRRRARPARPAPRRRARRPRAGGELRPRGEEERAMPNYSVEGHERAAGRIAGGRPRRREQGRRRSPRCASSRSSSPRSPRRARSSRCPSSAAAIRSKEIAIFTRQFSVMIDAGLPLVQCLEILGDAAGQQDLPEDPVRRSGRTSSPARRSPTRCASTPRSSTTCTATWSPPARRAVSSTPSCSACRSTSRRSSSCARAVRSAMVYPVGGHRDRDRRGLDHPVEGHPDLRDAVRGPRRRAAAADPDRDRALATSSARGGG